jgi:hypothetical protein
VDDWEKICAKARDDALQGDSQARAWLGKYLLGDPPAKNLLDLAVLQRDCETLADAVARIVSVRQSDEALVSAFCRAARRHEPDSPGDPAGK